ncbi:MAG: hypothetical protein ACFCUV_18425 [Rivularia sp. (in: cyanobacteria)]
MTKSSKFENQVANQLNNWVVQISTQIVSSNNLVATAKVSIKTKFYKTGVNRCIEGK